MAGGSPNGLSRLADHHRCPWSWYGKYKLELQLKGSQSPEAALGSCGHYCLEQFFLALRDGHPTPKPHELEGPLKQIATGHETQVAESLKWYQAWLAHWSVAPWAGRPVGIEAVFEATLGEIFPEMAKKYPHLVHRLKSIACDLIWEDPEGFLWIYDHKSKDGQERDYSTKGLRRRTEHINPYLVTPQNHRTQFYFYPHVLRLFTQQVVAGVRIHRYLRSEPYDFSVENIRMPMISANHSIEHIFALEDALVRTEERLDQGIAPVHNHFGCWFGDAGDAEPTTKKRSCQYLNLCCAPDAANREYALNTQYNRPQPRLPVLWGD